MWLSTDMPASLLPRLSVYFKKERRESSPHLDPAGYKSSGNPHLCPRNLDLAIFKSEGLLAAAR